MSPDLALLRRYHEHADAFAFRELVQAHAGMVFATARRVTRDAALAEDVAQETFLELARHAPAVKESVGAWLHRVASRRACNAVRDIGTRRRYEAAALADVDTAGRPEASWEEIEPLVDEALDALSDDLRDPLVRHFLEGHTQQAIAAELGVSQSTISRSLDRGIAELRAQLRQRGVFAGTTLAALFVAHATIAPPASLIASLGKLAVSGVGRGATAAIGSSAPSAMVRVWRRVFVATGSTAVVIALFMWFSPARSAAPAGPAVPGAAPNTTATADWQGRAFCPMCAPPLIGGRQPEHGIFVHQENGRDVIHDLRLADSVPDFHVRFCVPSMDDPVAVHVRGRPGVRDGRPVLTVASIERTRR